MGLGPVVAGVPAGSDVGRPALPADAVEVWDRLAPEALEAGTLTAGTVFAFGELCKLAAWLEKVRAEVEARGLTEVGLRLGSVYLSATRQLDLKLRAFRLAPDGKPLTEVPKPQSALERLKAQGRSLHLA